MSFRSFKKELDRKRMQEETTRELESAIRTLTQKRDHYVEEAQKAYRSGNTSQYTAMTALLKNAVFNLKQAQDMATNFTIARDMCEMQTLNKHFVHSLKSVMDDVYKTCKAVRVSTGEKSFMKAMYQQNLTSVQLQQALQTNHMTFSSNVSSLSDISDDEIKDLLGLEGSADFSADDNTLAALENAFEVPPAEKSAPPAARIGGADVAVPSGASAPMPAATPAATVESTPVNPSEIPVKRPAPKEKEDLPTPEDAVLKADGIGAGEGFVWDNIPVIGFEDIAGLQEVKEAVRIKVLLPLQNPEAFAGYERKNGGGLCLYGPPGTGKTMIAAAIAKEIGAKFCSVKPSDLLRQGVGNSERAVRELFTEARKFPCAVIYFDEMDSISPKFTRSQYARQLRSEFLAQLQGVESYGEDTGHLLFLICSTNKPWDIDSAFLRPGRFGTRIYVGLPDTEARRYMIARRFDKIRQKAVVAIAPDVDVDVLAEKTNGFNGADVSNLLDRIEELSVLRGLSTGEKTICAEDLDQALEDVHSSIQPEDLLKLKEWRCENDQ